MNTMMLPAQSSERKPGANLCEGCDFGNQVSISWWSCAFFFSACVSSQAALERQGVGL
jgi:hypothetical protein